MLEVVEWRLFICSLFTLKEVVAGEEGSFLALGGDPLLLLVQLSSAEGVKETVGRIFHY